MLFKTFHKRENNRSVTHLPAFRWSPTNICRENANKIFPILFQRSESFSAGFLQVGGGGNRMGDYFIVL